MYTPAPLNSMSSRAFSAACCHGPRKESVLRPRRIPKDEVAVFTSPSFVDAHPKGASPFGVMDVVGNVWQWTDEFVDEHTLQGS
jgi:hypothetical protein